MTTDRDLFLAVLALDAYNHGYNPGMLGVGSQIGKASIVSDSSIIPGSEAAGFYAVAYDWNGETVISYRGTTFELGLNTYNDIIYGWTLGVGYAAASQPQLAKDFYLEVTGRDVYNANQPTDVILTGHSLGGGLAAFVASLTGGQADIFNNIPFGSGTVAEIMSHDYLQGLADLSSLFGSGTLDTGSYAGLPPSSSNLHQFITLGEIATGFRALSPALATGVFTSQTGTAAVSVAAAAYGTYLDQSATSQILESYAGVGGIDHSTNLHSQALMVTLLFADVNQRTAWTAIGQQLFAAEFSDDVAGAIGYRPANDGGWYPKAAKMLAAIAYSAVDVDSPAAGKPFGDSAVRALFDDADDLGFMFSQGGLNRLLDRDDIKTSLAEIIVQGAGDLALAKNSDAETKSGVVTRSEDGSIVTVELDPTNWLATFEGSGAEKIIGLDHFGTAIIAATKSYAAASGLSTAQIDAAWEYWKGTLPFVTALGLATTHNDTVLDGRVAVPAKDGTPGGVILVGGDGVDDLWGGEGNDLLIAGRGSENTFYSGGGFDPYALT